MHSKGYSTSGLCTIIILVKTMLLILIAKMHNGAVFITETNCIYSTCIYYTQRQDVIHTIQRGGGKKAAWIHCYESRTTTIHWGMETTITWSIECLGQQERATRDHVLCHTHTTDHRKEKIGKSCEQQTPHILYNNIHPHQISVEKNTSEFNSRTCVCVWRMTGGPQLQVKMIKTETV